VRRNGHSDSSIYERRETKKTSIPQACAIVCCMPRPHLLFCPYLPLPPTDNPVKFADWELGSLQSFKDRWADPQFKAQATTFLSKFLRTDDEPIENPALLCRKGKQLDGRQPSQQEVRALALSLAFSFIDRNPRFLPENSHEGWGRVTADNAELYQWPIDLQQGQVTTKTGYIVSVRTGGYRISDARLVLRPPLDLHMPLITLSPDPLVLTGIYQTVLESLLSPGQNAAGGQIRIALEWFTKAWRNTATLHFPERLVFLKTAFEALTGTSRTNESARILRQIFEELPDATAKDSECLVWSPEEEPVSRTWIDRHGQSRSELMTDLEVWLREFGAVRNSIIHEGALPELIYPGSNPVYQPTTLKPAYHGDTFFTAEYLLRGAIKVMLSTKLGYKDAWRSDLFRTINAAVEEKE